MATPTYEHPFGRTPRTPDFIQMIDDIERVELTPHTRTLEQLRTYPHWYVSIMLR